MFIRQAHFRIVIISVLLLALVGCATKTKEAITRTDKDGHPPRHLIPKNLDKIPDADPKVEPLSRYGNRFKKNSTNIYVALKKKYAVMPTSRGYRARGQASWYGTKFQGRKTSSGEPYDMFAMTAAHRTLPLPTYARVTNVDNGKSIIVKVNDRGPFHNNRLIDLSYVAAHKLGIIGNGTGRVEVESVDPRDHPGMSKKGKNKLFGRTHLAKEATHPQPNEQLKMEEGPQTNGKVATAPATPVAGQNLSLPSKTQVSKTNPTKAATAIAVVTPKLKTTIAKPEITNNALAKGRVFLQLGSFNQKGNAEELVKKLGKFSSQPTQIAENKTDKGARYRVRIGPFNNRAEAQLLSQKLSSQEFPKPVVLAD